MSRRTGFTLVELLVATTMMAMIAGVGMAALSAGTRSAAKADAYGAMVSHGQAAIQQMTADIRAAVEYEEYRVMSLDNMHEGMPADTLDMIVAAKPRLDHETGEGAGARCEVGYYVENDEDTEAQWLIRREDATLDDDLLGGGAAALAGPYVAGLNLEFYDGLFWQDGWDDEEEPPEAVRIEVLVVDENGVANPTVFGTTVPFMVQ
ncbi:MAG: prepilin-type N-terminal cleavage/methylation domain-containing protein [bacterium]|nr:prepilin-type N-terminal cleavage/methylation domain-containing protein [bacterium]